MPESSAVLDDTLPSMQCTQTACDILLSSFSAASLSYIDHTCISGACQLYGEQHKCQAENGFLNGFSKCFNVSDLLRSYMNSLYCFINDTPHLMAIFHDNLGTRMSPFCILLEPRVMEMEMTTAATRRAKLQSNHHH